MPRQRIQNNAKSTLSVAVSSNTQASLTLQTGHGARFPYLASPDYFDVTLDDGTNVEVCKCVDRSGDVLTVLRGQQGTTAQAAFATGTKCELRFTQELARHMSFGIPANFMSVRPALNTSSWHVYGLGLPTVVGTASPFALVNSEWKTTQPLMRMFAAQSVQVPSHLRVPSNIGNIGRGFRSRIRFAPNLVPNSSHFFIGLVGTTGVVNSVQPPSSLTNAIVIGWANASQGTPLSLYRNDANVATAVALSSYFTATSAAAFELELSCVGSEARVDYVVRRLDVSSIADASSFFTTSLPANSLFLTIYAQMTSMVTSRGEWDFISATIDT